MEAAAGATIPSMPLAPAPSRRSSWFWIPVRVLLASFLFTLLSFAVCLLLAITGLMIRGALLGGRPDMTIAYRQIAFPAAIVGGAIALLGTIVLEVRQHRREKGERYPLRLR
jgi:hypothetical protein